MCDIFTERYIIEGVEIPNQEIYTKMIRFFDGLCVDKNEWYKIHPTKKLIHVLMDVFSQPEKETKLMNKINEYSSPRDLATILYHHIAYNEMFTIEFSPEEIDLIHQVGLFTVEQAYHSLNDKGLWNDAYSYPHDDITEEDMIIEKMVKTLLNMKRGYRI